MDCPYGQMDMKVITISRTSVLNHYAINEDVVVITTSAGKEIFIDAEDLPKVIPYTWCVGGTGYAMSRTMRDATLMHRLLLNAQKGEYVDHINGDTLDNRKCNLRLCRKQQNEFNTKVRTDNQSGYRGVCRARRGLYRAYITLNGRQHHLGHFLRPEDAARAYNKAARELFGEYARLNDIKD